MEFRNVKGEPVESIEEYPWRPAVYGVLIENNKLIFIQPNWDDKFCLPGGGMDKGETPREALKREFLEETGFEVEVNKTPMFADSHLYGDPVKNHYFQRITLYYEVKRISQEQSSDLDKETTEIIWRNIEELTENYFTFFQRDFLKIIFKK